MAVTRDAVIDWMRRFAEEMSEHRQELVRLDTAIGDGDHGTNMDRGMRKAMERLDGSEPDAPGDVLKTVAMALVSSVGGAAGPLYGTLFLQLSSGLGSEQEVDLAGYQPRGARPWRGCRRAARRSPATRRWSMRCFRPWRRSRRRATSTAGSAPRERGRTRRGWTATTPLVARKGRASYLGERSKDHQDPGATSVYYLFKSAAEALAG